MPIGVILFLALLPAALFFVWVSWATYKECELFGWPEAHRNRPPPSRFWAWLQRMAIG